MVLGLNFSFFQAQVCSGIIEHHGQIAALAKKVFENRRRQRATSNAVSRKKDRFRRIESSLIAVASYLPELNLQELTPLHHVLVVGLHWASPSAALDKNLSVQF